MKWSINVCWTKDGIEREKGEGGRERGSEGNEKEGLTKVYHMKVFENLKE